MVSSPQIESKAASPRRNEKDLFLGLLRCELINLALPIFSCCPTVEPAKLNPSHNQEIFQDIEHRDEIGEDEHLFLILSCPLQQLVDEL